MTNLKLEFSTIKHDFLAGIVVFLVAIPLCLGVALASGTPLFSGIISGMVGGLVISLLSGSRFSVSGPAAGLSAVVLSAVVKLGSFEMFLLSVMLAGIFQILIGVLRGGVIANYFPSSVIKGLLTSIGIILILKQIPHAFGYDVDNEGDFYFLQRDDANTFSEILNMISKIEIEATIIAAVSIFILLIWDKTPLKKISFFPAPLAVVLTGILMNESFKAFYPANALGKDHLVNVPVSQNLVEFVNFFTLPDFSQLLNPQVYLTAITIAIVASLETLLNLEATDKLDSEKHQSPKNKELIAQGVGNTLAGLIGGIPVTSVIVRSSVNIHSGAKTKWSAFFHGMLLLLSAICIPQLLNKIPLSCLAAILLITGLKLAKFSIFKDMYQKGFDQFIPFIFTVVAIVFSDLLIGVLAGLSVSTFFVLRSNFKNPFNLVKENFHTGEVLMIKLSDQVSFLNKASFSSIFEKIPSGTQVVLDAGKTDFIDPDVLEIIHEFKDFQAPVKNIQLSLVGFQEKYKLKNSIQFTTHTTKDIQRNLTPRDVIKILKEGNYRFTKNIRLERDLLRQVNGTSKEQHPIAAIVSCIDSRTTTELVFDMGLGDIFSIRLAGNVVNEDVLGSLEYACKVAGAKLVVILGHTNCGAIKAACDHFEMGNLTTLLNRIKPAVEAEKITLSDRTSNNRSFVMNVTKLNIAQVMKHIKEKSSILNEMIQKGEIGLVGGLYEVETGEVTLYEDEKLLAKTEKTLLRK